MHWFLRNCPEDGEAVQCRQIEVEHDQVRGIGQCRGKAALAVVAHVARMSAARKCACHMAGELPFILNYQDSHLVGGAHSIIRTQGP